MAKYSGITVEIGQREHETLYECDHRVCSDKNSCNCELCGFTNDITHAKNFELKHGMWVEKRRQSWAME